jgi:hypothetical protein
VAFGLICVVGELLMSLATSTGRITAGPQARCTTTSSSKNTHGSHMITDFLNSESLRDYQFVMHIVPGARIHASISPHHAF